MIVTKKKKIPMIANKNYKKNQPSYKFKKTNNFHLDLSHNY